MLRTWIIFFSRVAPSGVCDKSMICLIIYFADSVFPAPDSPLQFGRSWPEREAQIEWADSTRKDQRGITV
jgi:hypothetical protein